MDVTDQLARITVRASGDLGVEVTVNLDGMVVDLELTHAALAIGSTELAAEIYRLTRQAAGAAIAEGLAILEPAAGNDLLALLTDPAPVLVEDFAAIESWALS